MWLYLPQTYSAYAADTEDSNSDSLWQDLKPEPSVTWRGKPMPLRTWRRLCKPGGWLRLLSGLILQPSTATRGVAQWISLLRGSRVSRTASPVNAGVQLTLDGFSKTSQGLSANADQAYCSLKTSPDSEPAALHKHSRDLPRSGTMRRGLVEKHPTLELRTNATDSSLWPTITASTYGNNRGGSAGRVGPVRHSLNSLVKTWATSPNNSDSSKEKRWATPTARDHKDGFNPSNNAPTKSLLGRQAPRMWKAGKNTSSKVGLNPLFVEALMGLPVGWTDCVSSAMASAPNKQD